MVVGFKWLSVYHALGTTVAIWGAFAGGGEILRSHERFRFFGRS